MSEEDKKNEMYRNKLFLNAVLPVLKTIVDDSMKKAWEGKTGVCQISCHAEDGEMDGTHFLIEDGEWTVKRGVYKGEEKVNVDLVFKNRKHLNNFFLGKTLPMPKMKGMFTSKGFFMPFFKALLKMAGLLGSTSEPKKPEDAKLLVKCMIYLLSSGISVLNKMKHPDVFAWTERSPDRVYAWAVTGHDDLSAYIRIKAGNSKASRGVYKRSMPFFTMRFDSVSSALGILLGTADMIKFTQESKIVMEGGPEYGDQLGAYMTLVGEFIQG